jgi:hypothetical protein
METKKVTKWLKMSSLTFSLFSALMMARNGYAHEGEQGGHRHFRHGFMPYLTSAQLTSLAGLNLTDPQWKCFWRGLRKSNFEAAITSAGVTKGEKPTEEQRKAIRAAMKAGFSTAFTAQLSVAPTASCPFTKPSQD